MRTATMDTLEKARGEFDKQLRARIAEKERELQTLRTLLSALDEKPATRRRRQNCSACGRPGHSKRTCNAESIKADTSSLKD